MKNYLPSNQKGITQHALVACFLTISLITGMLCPQNVSAQKNQATQTDSVKAQPLNNPAPAAKPTYPKVVGYLSFILPLYTFSDGNVTGNFAHQTTTIGFPVGVNILYSDKFGFSYEFTPTIKASGGTSKMSNLLFDPGTMFRFEHGFTIITRLAFETSGRYGFTPVFNQVYARSKFVNYFVALSLPNRFGNSAPYSIGLNLQLGFTFN
jgi:hypothetical protein